MGARHAGLRIPVQRLRPVHQNASDGGIRVAIRLSAMRSARAARPADGPAMPRHVAAIPPRPCGERTQRQCPGRAVICENGTWRRLRMLRDVELKAAPQECSQKLPVPPALDAVALMLRVTLPASGGRTRGGFRSRGLPAAPPRRRSPSHWGSGCGTGSRSAARRATAGRR
jgi:hypothetical protein